METRTPIWRDLWLERWHHARRPVAIVLALFYATFLFLAFAWSRCFFDGCPNVDSLAAYQPGGAPVLLDRNGEVFADLSPAEREVVPLSSLPSHVAQAFLAVEDQRFHSHNGIDWRRVGGAMLANVRSGGFGQGFSTITMQLARNVFPERIPGQEQTTSRKLLEVRVAREIEERYSKEEILELYLNHIYFGNRARGIEPAARQYFGIPAERLSLPQAALLAAIPKAPSHYDPRRHPEKARERRDLVLSLMQEQGRVPRFMAEKARREPLALAPAPRQARVEAGLAPYFVEQVRHELEERFGTDLYTRPLRIVTTLDSGAQRAAEEELRRQLKSVESGALGSFKAKPYSASIQPGDDGTPYLQGAVVMLDAKGGDVLAWVGGRDYSHSQFDRVSRARRQPGSAFKPFVYASALSQGYVLSQPLIDKPLRVKMPNGTVWVPRNFTGRYEGSITVRDALVRSKNVATVRLAQAVGLGQVSGFARTAGIDEPVDELPSMALGTVAVSPLELTAAYTAFAGLGQVVEPRLILRVEDEDGKVLWRSQPERRQVLEPSVAYLITDVLSEALERGTGIRALSTGLKVPSAGKTGTTNEASDAWFVGYTPDLVAGVWIGFDQPRAILEDATGGRLAAPVWGRTMERVYRKRPQPEPWVRPASVVARRVDAPTGLLVEEGCRSSGAEELFVKGREPAAYCPGRESPPRHGFPAERLLAEREAQVAEEKAEEKARLAETREAEEHRRKEEAARLAKKESLARAEREADRREAEIAAREKALRAEQRSRAEEDRLARIEAEERRIRDEEEEDDEARRAESEDVEVEVVETSAGDLSGWWELTNTIQSTNYPDYQGLRLGYRIQIEQDGARIVGRGQKWSENGRPVASAGRTPLTVTGTVEGDTVTLQFTERGVRRSTTGGFTWQLSADRTALRGTFWSDAADTSGRSIARRLP